MFIDIPKDRTDLWEKFHSDNYPVWSFRSGEGDKYVLLKVMIWNRPANFITATTRVTASPSRRKAG